MNRPADPSRPAAPTAREISELLARLRDITARCRDVDAAERAQFLADKNALIARLAHAGAIPQGDIVESAWAGDEHGSHQAAPGHPHGASRVVDPDEERREQLARWHAEDQADGHDDYLTPFARGRYDAPGGTP